MPPKWITGFLRWYCQDEYRDEIEGDLLELYRRRVEQRGRRIASVMYFFNVLLFMRGYTLFPKNNTTQTRYSTMMINNYFKVFGRSFMRNKMVSVLTISGLIIGISSFLMLGLYVYDELSYDDFHEKKDRIFKYYEVTSNPRTGIVKSPRLQVGLANLLPSAIDQVEAAVRFNNNPKALVEANDKIFYEQKMAEADTAFFSVFDFPLLYGDPEHVLNEQHDIVISRKMALKYFDRLDVVGERLTIDMNNEYVISGVMEDLPHNSHFNFEFIQLFQIPSGANPWERICDTYVVAKGTGMQGQIEKRLGETLAQFKEEEHREFRNTSALGILPLEELHLEAGFKDGISGNPTGGDIRYVWLFSGIALLVLLISFVNYINLSTAAYIRRSFEMGIRKVIGAGRSQLIKQLYLETFFTIMAATLVSFLIVWLTLPAYNEFLGRSFSLLSLPWPFVPAFLFLLLLFTLLAGTYPAFYLSKFNLARILKGKMPLREKTNLRKYLVVFQFVVCQLLVISTVVIQKQLHFLQNKNLGFNKEQMLIVPIDRRSEARRVFLKNEFEKISGVESASLSSGPPGKLSMLNIAGSNEFEGPAHDSLKLMIDLFYVDFGFMENYEMTLREGRFFSADYTTDSTQAVIINKSLQEVLGWDKPIGKWIGGKNKRYVVGVIADFHNKSLKQGYEPTMFGLLKDQEKARTINIRLSTNEIRETVEKIESVWKSKVSDFPFEYYFLDDYYDNMYQTELRLGQTMNVFAGLSIAIGLFGLIGLTLLVTQRRVREIGIRKTFGASVKDIVGLVSAEFVLMVTIGIFIATPVAWYLTEEWLKNFTFKTSPGLLTMFMCGMFTIVVAMLAIGAQVYKAARANPVDALRSE